MKMTNTQLSSIYSSTKGGIFYVESLAELWIENSDIRYFNAPQGGRLVYQTSNTPMLLKVTGSYIRCEYYDYTQSTVDSQVNSENPASSSAFMILNSASDVTLSASSSTFYRCYTGNKGGVFYLESTATKSITLTANNF